MKFVINISLLFFLFLNISFSQEQNIIMTYNLLNYPGNDTTTRNPHFRTIFSNIQPDILVVQEINSQSGVDGFLNNVLKYVSSEFEAGLFINGPDTDNAVFYKSNIFTFISNIPIRTNLRDINEFRFVHNSTADTLIIYSLHLKAGTGSTNEALRAAEVDSLRKRTNALSPNTDFLVVGDFNIYSSNESAYQKLLDQNGSGYLLDLFTIPGTWNQQQYSSYHTQSTRTRSFGGGSTGGLDDRFDIILMSQGVMNGGGIAFIPGTYTIYGNDGNHYNDSINKPPNLAVGQLIADALHYSSDHLPVIAEFSFNSSYVELNPLIVLIEGLFDGTTMRPDSIIIELREDSYPYTLIDQVKTLIDSNGICSGKFLSAKNDIPYYIVIRHRNALETWSSTAHSFVNNQLSYDFTFSANMAYGNNLKLVNNKWCVYAGDVNQDGFINIDDLSFVFTESVKGTINYLMTDVNGDLFTEIEDVSIVFINNLMGIERKTPIRYSIQ
jgi:endonuclease/exonuclease/phosphatase family metal-dependent hydrolase